MERKCKNCNQPFTFHGNTRGLFCSRECYYEYRKDKKSEYRKAAYQLVTCSRCGKEFERRTQEVIRQKNNKHYCSKSCAAQRKYTPREKRPSSEITCAHCGVAFKARSSQIERGRKFCSSLCEKASKKEKTRGENNPNYRHGRNQGSARKIAERHYDQSCIICGFDIAVQIHHITPKSQGGTNDPTNLAVLCPNHHAMAERKLISANELIDAAQKAFKAG